MRQSKSNPTDQVPEDQPDGCLTFAASASLLSPVLAFGVQVANPLGNGCLPGFGLVGDVLQQAAWLQAELRGHPHLGWREPTAPRCFGPGLVSCCLARHRLA